MSVTLNILLQKPVNIKTAFYRIVENEDIDLIKLFLEDEKLDINILNTDKYIKYYCRDEYICEPDCYDYSDGETYTTYNENYEKVKKFQCRKRKH